MSSLRWDELRKITIDVLCFASLPISSLSGTGVLPGILVIITDCDTAGTVYSHCTAAAAARKLLTPGHTSQAIPCFASSSICSRIAPYNEGSPVCRRTTFLPSFSALTITSITSSRFIYALLYISQASFAYSSNSSLTSEPAYIITSASFKSFIPRTVIRSFAPGPAPTIFTI